VNDTEVQSWFEQNTPIHDATATGEIPVPELAIPYEPYANTLKMMADQLDYLQAQMAAVIDFVEKAEPFLALAAKYTQGSKLDKARAAMGLRHG
jgi:hypothetical protein